MNTHQSTQNVLPQDPNQVEELILDDIQRAVTSGHIIVADGASIDGQECEQRDAHSYFRHPLDRGSNDVPFPKITDLNSQPLQPLARKIAQRLSVNLPSKTRCLELGAGMGCAVSELHQHFGFELDIVSLTALAPHYTPQFDIEALQRFNPSTGFWEFPPDLAIYSRNESSYVNKQFIGNLGTVKLPYQKYDLVNERCGALYYSMGGNQPLRALKAVMDSVKPTGALCLQGGGEYTRELLDLIKKQYPDVKCISDENHIVVVFAECHLLDPLLFGR